MPDLPAIRFEPVAPSGCARILALRVSPAQRPHVGAIDTLLADAQACRGCLPLGIWEGAQPVGFVRIEADARTVAGFDIAPPSLGLRAFFIDARYQGRGLGTRVLHALLAHLSERFPHARGVALAVDDTNAAALALYQRAGFEPLHRGYHDGPIHPLRLLWRALPETRPSCTTTSVTSSN